MFLEMPYRELLEGLTTRQTGHMVFGNTLPPRDWCCWCLWCCTRNDTICVLLGLQGEKTGIGVLECGLHLFWREFLRVNLGKNKIFRHFEEALGHGTFLGIGDGKRNHFCSHNSLIA